MHRTVLVVVIVAAIAVIGESRAMADALNEQGAPARFVGRQACTTCHAAQHDLWLGSHHALAMQVAKEQTVLGDFQTTKGLTHFGVTSTFSTREGKFVARTEGADGQLHDYGVEYTFGVSPLQQYLIAWPGGRLQALSLAWDSRSKEDGGQRWFDLYPQENIAPTDVLHWTGLNQNWNFMCAECHSTDLQKHYDPQSNRYATTWAEINVSCEACHGPGSRHLECAKTRGEGQAWQEDARKGLVVPLQDRRNVQWVMDPTTGNAALSVPRSREAEMQMCARCHSRRSVIAKEYAYGRPLLDTHLPQLLDAGVYYADGQIQAEVYEYGSFLQSKMYHKGVTCSDCHEPHRLNLRAPGDAVCFQCHLAQKYTAASHHFHPPNSQGARCVECHMPTTTYMVIDPRHDHSIRIPRPDLSVQLGTPNACTKCHTDRAAEWAAAQVNTWYGRDLAGYQHYAEALHAGRTGRPDAESLLSTLARDASQPNIARATAMMQLRDYLSPASIDVIRLGLRDGDAMVRRAALSALEAIPPQDRPPMASPLLADTIRAVRIEAARVLAPVPADLMTAEQRPIFEQVLQEYVEAQLANAERPEAHLNLGALYAQRGHVTEAESAYNTARHLQPSFVQAYVDLADLYRVRGRDQEGERLLREGLAIVPSDAALYHALGLLLVRQKRLPEALAALEQAAKQSPDHGRYTYVYAVALQSTGKAREAISILEQALKHRPYDQEILFALAAFNRDLGMLNDAIAYAERLIAVSPYDPMAQQLLQQLRSPR